MPAMRWLKRSSYDVPTSAAADIRSTGTIPPAPDVDVGALSPNEQYEVLVNVIELTDAANPAPFTGTPPWGEPTPEDEYTSNEVLQENYQIPADVQGDITDDELQSVMWDAQGPAIPEWSWYNDQQLFGLAVPPGYPAYAQPIESGRTQITLPIRTEDRGWDAWSGKPALARVPFHTNDFPAYNASQSRGHGVVPIKLYEPYFKNTNLLRNQLLAELNKRGIHNVLVADVPSVPYTEEVMVEDPYALTPQQQEFGPEGVVP